MIKKIILIFTLFAFSILHANNINYKTAKNMPSIIDFEKRTPYHLQKNLNHALKDPLWQEANNKLLNERVQIQRGNKSYTSLDYDGIIELLYRSANNGNILSAFQGYELAVLLTRKRGKWGKRDIPRFASILMEHNICQGYLDMAYAYEYKWIDGLVNYAQAQKMITAGKKSCLNRNIPDFLHREWEENNARYQALLKWKKHK